MSIFDGEADTEGISKDPRLQKQLVRVYSALTDGAWQTLAEVGFKSDAPEASVSARIRDLRKDRFGGFTINHRHVGDGIHQYMLEKGSGDPSLVLSPLPTSPVTSKVCTVCDGRGQISVPTPPAQLEGQAEMFPLENV